jgi:hypothetical protein
MPTNYKGIYKRGQKTERPTHVLVEYADGTRFPLAIDIYETEESSPDWRALPWESDYKRHAASD